MARPAVMTLPLMESVEDFTADWARSTSDGHIDETEMARLGRKVKTIAAKCFRVHENTQGAVRDLTGDGIFGAWNVRMVKEARAHELRLVVKNDDPDPDGPVTKRAA